MNHMDSNGGKSGTPPTEPVNMAGTLRNVGRLVPNRSALFLCDLQEKFRPIVQYFPEIVAISGRMLHAAKALNMPVIITEQYPKGLGRTAAELGIDKYLDIKPVEKTQFSMCTPEIIGLMKSKYPDVDTIILCGIEAHVCVQNTALNLLENNFNVHLVVDACSSRSLVDRMYAYDRMKSSGVFLTTSEAVILGLLGGSLHPKFKEIQELIMKSAPDTGLLSMRSRN
ncbi:isochorismatase domain-containing protein 2-like isoform X2 [Varroa destructor]|uniref:Isochorismatase-like domain-containing protein n=1 Tax=Varroa destructor TaxID=109461 RepID=A0A7M7JUP1_VARDE|nr:isochorismatase domain-containing protein 2-like isoform X2 [Varroa destructor]